MGIKSEDEKVMDHLDIFILYKEEQLSNHGAFQESIMDGVENLKHEEILGRSISYKQNLKQKAIKNNKFSICEAYKQIIGEATNVEWRSLICHSTACPKQVFTLWIVLHGRLRTKDVLFK